jgi:homoserine O-acetyltransferase
MVALETAIERPSSVRHVLPMAAPTATGPLAIAWNHIQVELIAQLGEEGLRLARQIALTTYRSEADFDERFGRAVEADGTPSIVSYLAYQGDKLANRFDGETYQVLVRAMDSHDIGRDRGSSAAALGLLAEGGVRLTGVGITGDILYGPSQVHALLALADTAGVRTRYEEIASTKGHDAFLVEWDQVNAIVGRALESAAEDSSTA